MQVFISWSGERSKGIAEAIREWLPMVVQSVRPWMSDEDISAGSRWLTEVSTTLNIAKVGIICVTPENQHNPWLLFESGALSKTLEQTCVCPLVFGMTTGQLKGPLTQFQANALDRDGIGKIIATINRGLGERQIDVRQLDQILDVWWPKLNERLTVLADPPEPTITRTTEDQLEELLALARENLRRENLRLEGSRERDEKLDSLLGFMDKAGTAMGVLQQHAQVLQPRIQKHMLSTFAARKAPETLHGGDLSDLTDTTNAVLASVLPSNFDLSIVKDMTELLRGMQDNDRQRLSNMLSSTQIKTGE